MKAIILTSALALAGLFVTDAQAATKYSCVVQACQNANKPNEQCAIDDKERAVITDFVDGFSVKYGPSQTDVLSPGIDFEKDGYQTGIKVDDKTGDVFYFMRATTGVRYMVLNRSKSAAFIFGKCKFLVKG